MFHYEHGDKHFSSKYFQARTSQTLPILEKPKALNSFWKADVKSAIFKNVVLPGPTFNDANMKDVDFEGTLTGYIDLQKLCKNNKIN